MTRPGAVGQSAKAGCRSRQLPEGALAARMPTAQGHSPRHPSILPPLTPTAPHPGPTPRPHPAAADDHGVGRAGLPRRGLPARYRRHPAHAVPGAHCWARLVGATRAACLCLHNPPFWLCHTRRPCLWFLGPAAVTCRRQREAAPGSWPALVHCWRPASRTWCPPAFSE